jgi:photosystem II stability/assembly factor-like uncharacterized protein
MSYLIQNILKSCQQHIIACKKQGIEISSYINKTPACKINMKTPSILFLILFSAFFFTSFLISSKTHSAENAENISTIQPEPWEFIGPQNLSGRMLSVAVAPSNKEVLYAGSASGGLWKTNPVTNSGWERVTINFPINSISAIAIHPDNEDVIYLGTGEMYRYQKAGKGNIEEKNRGSFGIGILKSEDGGISWTKSLDWKKSDKRAIKKIKINPLNPNSVFATTSEGVYKTTNAGKSWKRVLSVIMAQDIVYSINDTSKIYVGCGSLNSEGRGFYSSFNAGKKWKKQQSFPDFSGKVALSLLETERWPVLYANVTDSNKSVGVYKSEKFGTTWKKLSSIDIVRDKGWYSNLLYIYANDVNHFIIGGDRLYSSYSSGTSVFGHDGVKSGFFDFSTSPGPSGVVYFASEGGIYRIYPYGQINKLSNGLHTVQFNKGVSASPVTADFILAGTQANGAISYSGGLNWNPLYTFTSSDPINFVDIGGQTAINQVDGNEFYLAFNENIIYKNRQELLREGLYGKPAFLPPLALSKSDPKLLYTASNYIFKLYPNPQIWVVLNGGEPLNGEPITTLALSDGNPNLILAATAPGKKRTQLFKSLNGGESWTTITGVFPNEAITDMAISDINPDSIFVTFDGYGNEHIFLSPNGGDDWQDLSTNLPDEPALSILFDPIRRNHLYLGMENGVYFSDNSGASWQSFMSGMDDPIVAMDMTFSKVSRKIILTAYGNGAYQTEPAYQPKIYLTTDANPISASRLLDVDDKISFSLNTKNFGIASTDTFRTVLRVFDSTQTKIYETHNDTCCIGPKSKSTIIIEPNYKAPGVGKYSAELVYPVEFGQKNDSTKFNFEIVSPTILKAEVETIASPFRKIKSVQKILNLPQKIALPFNFIFDGISYDVIRVNEDGWIEFGIEGNKGAFALSPATHSVDPATLTSTSGPLKVLAAWWEDLRKSKTIGVYADMSYITENISPNRVFIIQWLRIETASGTTILNFQVKFYENDNHIEICYGERIQGTYSGQGGVIGLKDAQGGDYHFLDISSRSYKAAGEFPTYRSPITQWPGPDSAIVVRTKTSKNKAGYNSSQTRLGYPFPNPFSTSVTIRYQLPANRLTKAKIVIYNILGHKIKTLINTKQTDGTKDIIWNGLNERGNAVASGIYIIELTVGKNRYCRKTILVH